MYPLGAYWLRTGSPSSTCDSKSRTRWGLGGRKCKPKMVCGALFWGFYKNKSSSIFQNISSMNQMESIFSSLSCLYDSMIRRWVHRCINLIRLYEWEPGTEIPPPGPRVTGDRDEAKYSEFWGSQLCGGEFQRFWAMLRDFAKETGNEQLLYTSDLCLWFQQGPVWVHPD